MSRRRAVPAAALMAAAAAAVGLADGPLPVPVGARRVLADRCTGCHSGSAAEGGVRLDVTQVDWDAPGAATFWSRVMEAVERRRMPPADETPLTTAERDSLRDWLDPPLLARIPCGGTPPRRLGRAEYEATIRRLLRLPDYHLPPGFPPDTERHGFDNLAEGLVLSPAHLEAYAMVPTEPAAPFATKLPEGATNTIGMRFRLCSPGRFLMGDANGSANEKPVHEIVITAPFYMAEHEVTNDQWKRVMGGLGRADSHPVNQVSWQEATEYCRRLSALPAEQESRRIYRLPTEAEWEYACRAGSKTRYFFGDDAGRLGEYAWFSGNSGRQWQAVGQRRANPWGIYDMHGNVWEWVSDPYELSTCQPATCQPATCQPAT